MEVILTDKDFTDLVFKYMGIDAENKVKEYIRLSDKAAHAVKTDLFNYESSLDSDNVCFNEVLDYLKILNDLINSTRINRVKVLDLIVKIENLISNQI